MTETKQEQPIAARIRSIFAAQRDARETAHRLVRELNKAQCEAIGVYPGDTIKWDYPERPTRTGTFARPTSGVIKSVHFWEPTEKCVAECHRITVTPFKKDGKLSGNPMHLYASDKFFRTIQLVAMGPRFKDEAGDV